MRILHAYKDYWPILGGIENHVRALAEAQARQGHTVTVLVTNPGGRKSREVINGVTVVRAGRLATVASTPISLAFPAELRRQQPDITHLHSPYPVAELSQYLAGRGRPYVITYHSDVVRQKLFLRLYRPWLRRVLVGARRIIATSPQYVASSPFLGPLAARCSVVPLGIDPGPLLTLTHQEIRQAAPRLLFVGRHRYYKGLDGLLRALTIAPGLLWVVGDGPMRPAWEKLSRELSLTDRVHFLGELDDEALRPYYSEADIFALPASSRAEAFGTVLLEAMAAGLPCITTELGTGTSYVVQDGVTGLVAPANDWRALATAVQRLADNPHWAREMGRAGRQRLLDHFTLERMVAAVEGVYRSALAATHS
jgi:rhamnosyl/mannosyltransferase